MTKFIGEYECKLDSKGRLIIPVRLKRQLPPEDQEVLVINRGLDKCLVVFTRNEWERETSKLDQLNYFDPQDRKFVRMFNNGATLLNVDLNDRILIPKNLLEYAEIRSDVVLSAYNNRIEIWDKKTYDQELNISPEEMSQLAKEVMSKMSKPSSET